MVLSNNVYNNKSIRFWVAGILEGEGSFYISYKTNSTGEDYPTFRCQCNMTDRDIIQRLKDAIPYSKMSPPINVKGGTKPVSTFSLHRRDEVRRLIKCLYTIMGIRRQKKMRELLYSMKQNPKRSWTHGTRWGYEGQGCKCRPCMNAHNLHARNMRKKRKRISL